jgi:ATP phosphoribosyltransferase
MCQVSTNPALQCRLIRRRRYRGTSNSAARRRHHGYDWIYENNSDVLEVSEMCYSKATSAPCAGCSRCRTTRHPERQGPPGQAHRHEAVGLTRRYLAQHGVSAEVEFRGAQPK